MVSDFIVNVQELGYKRDKVNIYPIGDVQKGSAGLDMELYEKWKKMVLSDPDGFMVIVGDMINNGLKTSKTNSYREVLQPHEQKRWLIDEIYDLQDRIIGAVAGNHELRSVDAADMCPLYDAMLVNGLDDFYRENLNAIKVVIGDKGGGKPVAYMLVLHHGLGGKRAEDIGYQIEGCDAVITGHTHQPKSLFPARLVFDPYNNVMREAAFTHIVVPSFDRAGYTIKAAYKLQARNMVPVLQLSGTNKKMRLTWEEL